MQHRNYLYFQMNKRIVHHLTWLQRLALLPLYGLLRLWYGTIRLKLDATSQAIMRSSSSKPCVFYFWHHNLFIAPKLRKLRNPRAMYGLMSASKDGAWLEALVKKFDVFAIRGSSSWRGSLALQELEQHKQEDCDIVITPDGPKGPRCQCKPGSLRWVWQNNFDVIALHFEFSNAYKLKSWDQFCIPRPFSHVKVKATFILPKESDLAAFQTKMQSVL